MKYLMKCGCVAQGVDAKTRKPVCAVHVGLTPDAEIVVETPDLTGRMARCVYCGAKEKSDFELPFFEYRQNENFDRYYCGCRGWD